MQINLKMLKVLILGGSRGIGLEIAKALHSGGGGGECV
ncbi:SDR family oxidoreductase [Helicobacter cinaedi]|nr:SDR family oxidoreductase [Helicobacter cinaedi]